MVKHFMYNNMEEIKEIIREEIVLEDGTIQYIYR